VPNQFAKAKSLQSLQRIGMASAGSVCLVAGLLLYPFPIPLGLPLLILGLTLWMRTSRNLKFWILQRTRGYPRIRRFLHKLSGSRHVPSQRWATGSTGPETGA